MASWRGVSLVILFLMVGCNRSNQGQESRGIVEDLKAGKVTISVSADSLSNEFSTDASVANKKYVGAVVEVTGRSRGAGVESVLLEAGNGRSIVCKVNPQDVKTAYGTSKGQKLRVRGVVESYRNPDVYLSNCVLFELEPSNVITVSAEELASEFEKDNKSAVAKYSSNGNFLISGVVAELPKAGSSVVRLETAKGKLGVLVGVRQADHNLLQIGRQVLISADSAVGDASAVVVFGIEGARILK